MISSLLIIALTAASGASALVPRGVCNANNCLRALRATSPKTRLAQAQADCAAWLTITSTPVETATAYTTLADLTSTLVEEVTAIETIYETSTTTVRETPTDTVYTATTTLTVEPDTVVNKRAASPTLPAYASPCSGVAAYSSACSCIGVSGVATITAPTSTTTVILPTTALTTIPATSVVSTSSTIIYDATTTITLTEPAATVSTETVVTVTRSSTSSAPAAPTSLITNADFEAQSSIAPWGLFGSAAANTVGSLSVDATTVHSGSQSGLLNILRQGVVGINQPVTVEADQNYRFTIFVQQATPACPYIYIGCSTAPNNYFTVSTYAGGLANKKWYELGVTCRWTSDRVAAARVSVFVSNCASGGKVFFDDASLVKQ